MQQRIINILFGVIIVILTGTVIYLTFGNKSTPVANITPTPVKTTVKPPMIATDETANWKTYTDSQYGFEVKYPGDYSISKPDNANTSFKSTDKCKALADGGGEWPIDCLNYTLYVQQDKLTGGFEPSKTTVAGLPTEKSTISSEALWINMTQTMVQFQKGQRWYVQTFTYNKNQSAVAESTMNKILTSFKFTDQTSDFATSDWKTYTNTSLGFSIKYPLDWKIDSLRSDRTKSGSDVVFDIGIPKSHEGTRVDVTNQTLAEWRSSFDNSIIEQTLNLTVDGQPAIRVDTTEFGQKLVATKFNGKLYIFRTGGRMIDNGMLSTVKFIK